ncbi:MAG: SpoIIE family protein phosphatase, partial [Acidobacteriota bacterium]
SMKSPTITGAGEGTVILPAIADDEAAAAPPDDLKHFLVGLAGATEGQRFGIGRRPVVLGRRQAEIVLDDPAVSGRHCRVTLSGDDLWVEDLGSSNGTFVDGRRISAATAVPVGHALRLGASELRHELRSRDELQQHDELGLDLDRAAVYVESLLPPPLDAEDVSIRFRFRPCAKLGGDGFSYQWIDDDHLAVYVIDVCGHGVRSSLHAVSVVQLLRAASLTETDFRQPSEVLAGLNRVFPMEQHGGMYFTAWYGVYVRPERRLRYASAGHPPAVLLGGDAPRRLSTRQPAIGMADALHFVQDAIDLPCRARLFTFSDGVYELGLPDGTTWTLDDFLRVLHDADRRSADDELDAIEGRLQSLQGHAHYDDDFSLLVVDFDLDAGAA